MKNVKFLQNKRGVSPLIATVLLIAFAVALGAVVMNWGREYIEDTQKDVEIKSAQTSACIIDVSLSLVKISDKPCYERTADGSDNIFHAIIENGDSTELTGYKITFIGDEETIGNNGILTHEINDSIKQAEIISVDVEYGNLDATIIDIVKIVPKLKISGAGGETFCTQSAIEIEDIRDCS
ncbi:MAG: archaellin/type IV pilin N-terminal domain-containing protein [Candidatus Woesearchaeota archaeon]